MLEEKHTQSRTGYTKKLIRNDFSGFEEDVDKLFMRYFRKDTGEPTIFVQGNAVKTYFFNEYVALRNESLFPQFPCLVVTPLVPKESTDMPFYTSPFIRKTLASDGTLTFYKFESLVWKDFMYQVDAYTKDFQVQRRLHALLANKLFPKISGARYFKVMDGEYRQLDISEVSGWNADPEGTFRSTVTYTIKIPVWEVEPIVQGSLVQVNFEFLLSDLLLEVENLPSDSTYKVSLTQKIKEALKNKNNLSEEKLKDLFWESLQSYNNYKNSV